MARSLGDAPWFPAVRFVVFAVLTFVAGYLGRLTFDDDLQIGLIVPASGVAVLWLATGSRRTRVADVLGIAVTVAAALRLEGATWQQLTLAVILTLVTAVTWLVLVRRVLPDLRGVGGGLRRPGARPRPLPAGRRPARRPDLGRRSGGAGHHGAVHPATAGTRRASYAGRDRHAMMNGCCAVTRTE